ncbi:AAA-like domain-containing protein [Leptothermofonsia sichuanensis E412]|uniref:AAA-like domain-containing protein n=1 Tax=Leptothermofonsia sichuanensis TaxID=2917832 RepID=UPI001CA72161|nr:AAA-like domain-containing protein [Leptothermofonsia sichuanensis]QZZ21088.1 AAA-like domain-containing protein [Leptothermofonsia sichuanensis E412]
MMDRKQQYRYQVGGPLSEDNLTYVEREADKDLYDALEAGEYCYVLNSRQMGKSSLVVRTRKKLEAEGFTFAYIDLTLVGTEDVSLDQWCTTLLSNLADSFQLDVDAASWWKTHEGLTPLDRMTRFIETFLLVRETPKRYIIVIDEIDTVLSLKKFRADDFFAFVRGCCIRRIHKPEYQRLTFVLIGTATPSDLIADRDRTPFNLGRAISLYGFRLSEVHPLTKGLESCPVENPQAVLEAILNWTGGQPFLTQKLCQLILDNQVSIPTGQESSVIAQLVKVHIIHNWEGNDEPQHLRTIRDRIIRNVKQDNIMNVKDEQHASNLLSAYQKILQHGKVSADNSSEQEDLRLSGLVVKQDGVLKVYNRIYQEVFNERWVQKELANLRPYREQIKAWSSSNQSDESRLLHGRALQDALEWAKGKQLSEEDNQFLEASQTFEQLSKAKPEVAAIFKQYLPELQAITSSPSLIIQEVLRWAGSEPSLAEQICQLLIRERADLPIPAGEEAEEIEHLIQTHLIQDWENQPAADLLRHIRNSIRREDEKGTELLTLYQKILQQAEINDANPVQLEFLQSLGLIADGKVANLFYRRAFNEAWVEQEIEQASQRRYICGRYQEIEKLSEGDFVQTYMVTDTHLPGKDPCILREFIPVSNDAETIRKTRDSLDEIFRKLEKLRGHKQIPTLLNFLKKDERFYITQEFVEGENLDKEIKTVNVKDKSDDLLKELESIRWEESKVIQLLIEILEILEFVHRQNLYHLNIKPSNLRRRKQDGRIILIDFADLKGVNTSAALNPSLSSHAISEANVSDQESLNGFSRDIYDVGMIGIQALTGIHPSCLSLDQTTHETIWLYKVIPDIPLPQISDRLATILSKMIRHRPDQRYAGVSEVLADLRALKENASAVSPATPPFWQANKRIVVWGGAGLVLTGLVAGILAAWNVQRFLSHQQITRQHIEQCNQKITLKSNPDNPGSRNLVNSLTSQQLLIDSNRVIEACTNALQKQPDESEFLKNRGKAFLLLWNHASHLNNQMDAEGNLKSALNDFTAASHIRQNDAQTLFYKGLTQNFLKDSDSFEASYQAAIDRYLSRGKAQIQEEDIPILVKLASFSQEEAFSKAKAIFDRVTDIKSGSVNLIYNRGSSSAIGGNYQDATGYFKAVLKMNRSNFDALRSLGFVYLLWGKQNEAKQYFAQANQVKPGDPLIAKYSAEQNLNYEKLKPSFEAIFPYLPVYQCQEYPVLAIAEKDARNPLCHF